MERRRFLWGALGLGACAGAGWRLAAPATRPLPVVLADDASALRGSLGGVRLFPSAQVAAVVQPKGLALLSTRCTHLGCALRAGDGELVCPCHGGRFALDGSVRAGPPPRPLPWLSGQVDPRGRLLLFPGREDRARRLIAL
jgi:nitrite reductase/ring-hydroxylating ferredoxin subunit